MASVSGAHVHPDWASRAGAEKRFTQRLQKDYHYGLGLQKTILIAVLGSLIPSVYGASTHRLLSSSFLGLPYRILHVNHKKELLRSLWVG